MQIQLKLVTVEDGLKSGKGLENEENRTVRLETFNGLPHELKSHMHRVILRASPTEILDCCIPPQDGADSSTKNWTEQKCLDAPSQSLPNDNSWDKILKTSIIQNIANPILEIPSEKAQEVKLQLESSQMRRQSSPHPYVDPSGGPGLYYIRSVTDYPYNVRDDENHHSGCMEITKKRLRFAANILWACLSSAEDF